MIYRRPLPVPALGEAAAMTRQKCKMSATHNSQLISRSNMTIDFI